MIYPHRRLIINVYSIESLKNKITNTQITATSLNDTENTDPEYCG